MRLSPLFVLAIIIHIVLQTGSKALAIQARSPNRDCSRWAGKQTIRVLFVGNSQTDFWDMGRIVEALAASGPENCPRVIPDGSAIVSGANLDTIRNQTLSDGQTLKAKLNSGQYDAVVIQESIDLYECRLQSPRRACGSYMMAFPRSFERAATAIVKLARKNNVLPVFYATGYIEQLAHFPDRPGFNEMLRPQLRLARQLNVPVAAAGLAWLQAWQENPQLDLYFRDRQHPGYKGSYISALTIYNALVGASPMGLTSEVHYTPDAVWDFACTQDFPCWTIGPEEAALFQRAAKRAQALVRNPEFQP